MGWKQDQIFNAILLEADAYAAEISLNVFLSWQQEAGKACGNLFLSSESRPFCRILILSRQPEDQVEKRLKISREFWICELCRSEPTEVSSIIKSIMAY